MHLNAPAWRHCVAAIFFFLCGPAGAQSDTAQARQVFAEVNRQLVSMQTASFAAKRPDVEYRSEVKAWADAGGVRKLEVTDRDDDGDVVTEYYYDKGALVFAFQVVKGYKDGRRQQVTRNEERQYFRDGSMFKWLGGMDKVDHAPRGADFIEESRTRQAASAFYVKTATQALARGATARPPGK